MKNDESRVVTVTELAPPRPAENELTGVLEAIRSGTQVQIERACIVLRNKYLSKITSSLVYKMGGYPEIVSSGVTDAFILLWKNLRNGSLLPENILNPKAFLYDLAWKKVIDHLRTNQKWKVEAYFSQLGPGVMAGLGYNPSSHRTGSRFNLSPLGWDICTRHYLYGETITEIATELMMTEKAVKKEISRSKKQVCATGKVKSPDTPDDELETESD